MTSTPINIVGDGRPPAAPGRPTWDAEILAHLRAHVSSEGSLISEYADAIGRIEDADIRYLMDLVLKDEVRHHRMFEELVHAVEGAQSWQHVGPSVPARGTGALPDDVRHITERFLDAEYEDRRQLKTLRRELSPVEQTTLWALIVDLMALDTEKHIRILEAIASRKSG
jgi:rubrerythrin